MLAWHVLLSGSKQGCESGGWLETLLSSPAVIHGGVGDTRFGGLEWREPHVLLSMVDQLRSGVLSMGSGRGLDVRWACCHLEQQTVSTIPAWIFLGVVRFGLSQLWIGWDHAVPPVIEQGSVCISRRGVACPCCARGAGRAGKGIVKMGQWARWLVRGWFPPLFGCVVISDRETQVSSNTFEFADPSGFQHRVWLGRTTPP